MTMFQKKKTMHNNFFFNPSEPDGRSNKGLLLGSLIGCMVLLLILAVSSLFTSCSTTKENSFIEQHRVESLMSRMDSVINTKTVVQQDSSWRELILRQFESIREKSDTSHTFVVDSSGKVIKEKLIINNVREVTSATDRQEREVMMHRMEVMDSTINVMRQQIQHSDSLLQAKQTTIEKLVEKQLSSWQAARLWLGNMVLVALAISAAVFVFKKRAWWLKILKKFI